MQPQRRRCHAAGGAHTDCPPVRMCVVALLNPFLSSPLSLSLARARLPSCCALDLFSGVALHIPYPRDCDHEAVARRRQQQAKQDDGQTLSARLKNGLIPAIGLLHWIPVRWLTTEIGIFDNHVLQPRRHFLSTLYIAYSGFYAAMWKRGCFLCICVMLLSNNLKE